MKQVFNPYLPSYEYIPDGEPYVFDDRVYVYGSHDRFGSKRFCLNDYVCWSAPVQDLTDWRYEGVIYRKDQDPLNLNKEQMDSLFAPDVQKGTDGRYYLYYSLGSSRIMSVAVCDKPAGAYEFYGYVSYPDGRILGEDMEEDRQFDPGVFLDDDGQVYLYSGFCPEVPVEMLEKHGKVSEYSHVIKLESDMKTIKEPPRDLIPAKNTSVGTSFEGHGFFEASSMRKINGIYYFIYSSQLCHELCYATSKYPDRDFVYGGTIVSNGDIGLDGINNPKEAAYYTGNNHGSIVLAGGQWYVFYHRQTNGDLFSRQGCAEKIDFLPDGTIHQVEITSCGLNPGLLAGKGVYPTGIACGLAGKDGACSYQFDGEETRKMHPYITQSGEDRENQPEQYITNMQDGSVAGFKYFDFHDAHEISVTVRGTGNGRIYVTDEKQGNILLADIVVTPSQTNITFTAPFMVSNGKHALHFTYKGSGSIDFIQFELN